MSRPTTLVLGGTVYWVIRLYDANGELVDADSTPTVAVRKNGSAVGDSVTVTKRSATTGIYDCEHNPSGEAEADNFTYEESGTVGGTAYENSWSLTVTAVERGTNGANTTAPATPTNVSDAQTAILAKLPDTLVSGSIKAHVVSAADDSITDAAIASDAVAAIQSGLATATNLGTVLDVSSYCLAALAGSCSDAGTSGETYTIIVDGSTYKLDYTGLDTTGNRGTTTRTKI